MLLYEASRSIPLADVPHVSVPVVEYEYAETDWQLQSPVAEFTGQTIPVRIGFSPILRAGTGLLERAWCSSALGCSSAACIPAVTGMLMLSRA